MGRQWDPESINTSTSLDEGTYRVRSKGVEEVFTKGSETALAGKLMYVHQMEVVEPHEMAGLLQRDNWVIGSDTDLLADDPETWKAAIGAKAMKKAMMAARIAMTRELENDLAKLTGQEFLIRVKHSPDKKDSSRTNINVADYYPLGQRPIGLKAAAGNGGVVRQAAPTPKASVPATGGQTASVASAKTVAKPVDIACPSCEWKGPRKEFPAHAQTHDEGDDE